MKKLRIELDLVYSGRKLTKQDYPACTAACYVKGDINTIALDYSGQGYENKFHLTLMELFQTKLGNIPDRKSPVTGSKNSIGNCAEQRAANDMLLHAGCNVSELAFSGAMRPRTMIFYPYCENCQELFFKR